MTRATAATTLRALVAVVLTAVVLWKSEPGRVLQVTLGADLRFIGLAVALVLVDRALMAWRWLILLHPVTAPPRPRLGTVMHVFFVSTFVGTFLGPVSVGSDAVRAYGLIRQNVAGAAAVASVFVDRMLGVLSVVMLAVFGLALARDLAGSPLVLVPLAVAAATCLATAVAVFSGRAGAWGAALASRLPGRRVRGIGQSLIAAVQRYGQARGALALVLGSSLAVQGLRILQAWLLGLSLGIQASFAAYFAFIPLILLVMLLPITVFGLGTSQWAFVWFFAHAGVAEPAAFALSILFVALGVVGNLPGAFLFARDGLHRPPPQEVPPGGEADPPPAYRKDVPRMR